MFWPLRSVTDAISGAEAPYVRASRRKALAFLLFMKILSAQVLGARQVKVFSALVFEAVRDRL